MGRGLIGTADDDPLNTFGIYQVYFDPIAGTDTGQTVGSDLPIVCVFPSAIQFRDLAVDLGPVELIGRIRLIG